MNRQDLGNVQAGARNLGVISIQIEIKTTRLYEVTKEGSKDRKKTGPSSESWGTYILRVEGDEEKPGKRTEKQQLGRWKKKYQDSGVCLEASEKACQGGQSDQELLISMIKVYYFVLCT